MAGAVGSSLMGSTSLGSGHAGVWSVSPFAVAPGPFVTPLITAPIIARTSTAGASPFTWSVAIDATVYAGYTWRLQTATDSAFTGIIQDLYKQVSQADLTAVDTAWLASSVPPSVNSVGVLTSFATPVGLFYMRMRVERSDGTVSAWSNAINDTITATGLAATAGQDRNANVTVSGGPPALTYVTNGGTGSIQLVRMTRAALGAKTHVEITLTNWASFNHVIGVDNRTVNFNASTNVPGKNDATGVSLNGFNGINKNSAGTVITVTQPVNGDIMAIEWDATNISFYNVHLGVTTQLGTTTAHGLGTAALSLFAGQAGSGANEAGTINVGGTAYAMTPTATYGNY